MVLHVAPASPAELLREARALSRMLIDAVHAGAGMGFAPPLAEKDAEAYWHGVAREVAAGTRVALLARLDEVVVGSAQLDLCQRSNGRHRAEVQKVVVDERARRRGVGLAIMRAVDDAARGLGRTTLVLDTFAHQDARRLYEAAGWTHAGDIPAFAQTVEGTLEATSYYYKLL